MRKLFVLIFLISALLLAGCQPASTSTKQPTNTLPANPQPTDTAAPTAPAEPTSPPTEPAQTADTAIPVTTNPAVEFHPKWSPDGETLGYVSFANDAAEIWLMSAQDGSIQPITFEMGGDFAFVWSSDSSRLIFDAYDSSDHLAVWRMDLPDGAPVQVTEQGAGKGNPAISPDDSTIAYATLGDIWVQTLVDGVSGNLTTDPADDWHPTWSPDGTIMLFTSNRSGNADLWTIPTAGGEATQITAYDGYDDRGQWSPDGRFIVFVSERSGNEDIWLYSMEDQSTTQVTYDNSRDTMPDWHPDGESIVFVSERSGNLDIWRIDVSELLAGS